MILPKIPVPDSRSPQIIEKDEFVEENVFCSDNHAKNVVIKCENCDKMRKQNETSKQKFKIFLIKLIRILQAIKTERNQRNQVLQKYLLSTDKVVKMVVGCVLESTIFQIWIKILLQYLCYLTYINKHSFDMFGIVL